MIYKYTSFKEVIAKVYRDLEIKDSNRWIDMIEWGAEALEKIGAIQQYDNIVEKYTVSDYRVKLPCNFIQLDQIYYNGYPLDRATSTFGNVLVNPNLNSTIDPIVLDALQGDIVLLKPELPRPINRDTFTINGGYITTSFREGDIYIGYTRIGVDEEGFPMIPDDVNYKQALFWYIAMMLQLPEWFAGEKNNFERCKQIWEQKCGQAGTKAMMPDITQLENIKNSWVRLIPEINAADTFFMYQKNQERLNL